MAEPYAQFVKRLDGLNQKHQVSARGQVAQTGPDGLVTIVAKPKDRVARFRIVLGIIAGFFAFKALTLTFTDPITYQGRVDSLAGGNAFEQICAWVMQADPVTQALVATLTKLLT